MRLERREKRTLIVSILVAALTAVAFQEMVTAVGHERELGTFELRTWLMVLVFCLTTVRFFIGAALHLTSPHLLEAHGFTWMFDLLVILSETLAMIFLGSASTLTQARNGAGFVYILLLLLAIDIVWVLAQSALGIIVRFRREEIPWEWLGINTALFAGILVTLALTAADPSGIYGLPGMAALAAMNLVAFAVDLFTVDRYGLL